MRLASITYSPTRILDGIKSLSYAANMLASRLAREQGFDEALLVTPHGRVLEAPTSSIFWVQDGDVLTPPLDDHILASITRAAVIERDRRGRAAVHARGSRRAPTRRSSRRRSARSSRSRRSTITSVRASGPVTARNGGESPSDPDPSWQRGRVKVLTVIGNRPQFIKAAAVSPPAARVARRGADPHRPALRRRAVGGVLRRARDPGAGPGARDRARLEHLADRADARGARAGARARSDPMSCSSTATRTRRSPERSPGPRRGCRSRTSRPACARSTARCPRSSTASSTDHASSLLLCSSAVAAENLRREAVAGERRRSSAT